MTPVLVACPEASKAYKKALSPRSTDVTPRLRACCYLNLGGTHNPASRAVPMRAYPNRRLRKHAHAREGDGGFPRGSRGRGRPVPGPRGRDPAHAGPIRPRNLIQSRSGALLVLDLPERRPEVWGAPGGAVRARARRRSDTCSPHWTAIGHATRPSAATGPPCPHRPAGRWIGAASWPRPRRAAGRIGKSMGVGVAQSLDQKVGI